MIGEFLAAFVRPMLSPVTVAVFLIGGGVRPVLIVAVSLGMYFMLLGIGRQGGWK